MPFFTFGEIFDIVIMTVIVGYIFSGVFKKPVAHDYDPLKHFKPGFNFDDMKFAILVTAPAIIIHELGHKFVALGFGMSATFQAAYTFLVLGLALKLLSFPFIFFVPAFVSITGTGTALQFSLIAFAGPGINLILWLGTKLIIKQKLLPQKYSPALLLTSRINMFLFIFNMLPIPGFDGSKVLNGLLAYF